MVRILNLLLTTDRAFLHHGKRLVLAILFAPFDHGYARRAQESNREGFNVFR